jgi:ribosomal protein S18 acetylase RimI-like enzyme
MTTTLRPQGPEEPLSGGGRSRRYTVCVNGRPVGAVRATAQALARPPASGLTGEIAELEITEDRRRGRGTVAALAAEEVLRGWGCTRVDVTVPEAAGEALRLATALGYRERMRNMAKRLPERPPALPQGLVERPIGVAEFPRWLAAAEESYLQALLSSGLTGGQARAKSEADRRAALPEGVETPGAVLRHLVPGSADAEPVGSVWVQLTGRTSPSGGPLAWVMSVEVAEAARRRGYGRALMLLAERACLAARVHDLGLNVFSGNEAAIGLYTSLGYRVTDRTLGKPLL